MKQIMTCMSLLLLLSQCSKLEQQTTTNSCTTQEVINQGYNKAAALSQTVEKYVKQGIPGVSILVQTASGDIWGTAKGYAKIEDKTSMELCHLQYLQSITKTYMAAGILKLYEEDKLQLEEPITRYLPARYSRYIDKAENITVKMLLNHTSGVPDYTEVSEYVTYLLQHPEHVFSSGEFLKFIEKKKLEFTPGTQFDYSNTNYLLLALIGDAVEGNHATLIERAVLKPLGLKNTGYKNDPAYMKYPNLVNSYWDRYSNGVVENVSKMQYASILSSNGDDGMVATPMDALKFLKGLMEGQLLKPATMQLMLNWVRDEKSEPVYGLGLYNERFNGKTAYGHGGAGIGSGGALYYFPEGGTYIFIATNIGVLVEGPLVDKVEAMKDEILEIFLHS